MACRLTAKRLLRTSSAGKWSCYFVLRTEVGKVGRLVVGMYGHNGSISIGANRAGIDEFRIGRKRGL